jgi:hypothetical protein
MVVHVAREWMSAVEENLEVHHIPCRKKPQNYSFLNDINVFIECDKRACFAGVEAQAVIAKKFPVSSLAVLGGSPQGRFSSRRQKGRYEEREYRCL